jgi:hypothetical protein
MKNRDPGVRKGILTGGRGEKGDRILNREICEICERGRVLQKDAKGTKKA